MEALLLFFADYGRILRAIQLVVRCISRLYREVILFVSCLLFSGLLLLSLSFNSGQHDYYRSLNRATHSDVMVERIDGKQFVSIKGVVNKKQLAIEQAGNNTLKRSIESDYNHRLKEIASKSDTLENVRKVIASDLHIAANKIVASVLIPARLNIKKAVLKNTEINFFHGQSDIWLKTLPPARDLQPIVDSGGVVISNRLAMKLFNQVILPDNDAILTMGKLGHSHLVDIHVVRSVDSGGTTDVIYLSSVTLAALGFSSKANMIGIDLDNSSAAQVKENLLTIMPDSIKVTTAAEHQDRPTGFLPLITYYSQGLLGLLVMILVGCFSQVCSSNHRLQQRLLDQLYYYDFGLIKTFVGLCCFNMLPVIAGLGAGLLSYTFLLHNWVEQSGLFSGYGGNGVMTTTVIVLMAVVLFLVLVNAAHFWWKNLQGGRLC